MYGGVTLLLPDRNLQNDSQTTDHEGLKAAKMWLKEDCALKTIQQGWKDNAVQNTKRGTGLDLTLIPQRPR